MAAGVAARITTVTYAGKAPMFVGRLPSVTSVGGCEPGAVAALDGAGVLPSLEEVELTHASAPELALLASKAPRLKRLIVGGGGPRDPKLAQEGLDIIGKGAFRLTHLLMGEQDLKGAKAGKTLATAPAFAELQALDLSQNPLTDAFFPALLARSHPALRFLRLHSVKMGDAGLKTLAATPNLPALESLDISSDSRRDLGGSIAALTAGRFSRLLRLDVRGLCATAESVIGLFEGSGLPRLEELRVDGALDIERIVTTAPQTLSMPLRRLQWSGRAEKDLPWDRLHWFADLRALDCFYQLRAGGVESFLTRAPIAGLTSLGIASAELHGAGASLLAKVPFTRLRRLDVYSTKLFPDVIGPLLDAPWLDGLEALNVAADEVGPDALARLKARVKRVETFRVFGDSHARAIQWYDPLEEDGVAGAPPEGTPVGSPRSPEPNHAAEAAAPAVWVSAGPPAEEPAEDLAPFVNAAAACSPIIDLVREIAADSTLGEGSVEKGKIVFEKRDWKLCVLVKAVPNRILEPWQRAGINLSVDVVVRIPKLERAFDPAISDKAYAKLPYREDATLPPTLYGTVGTPVGNGWRWGLSEVGGPRRMAAHVVERIERWVPLVSSLEEIARRAAWAAPELKAKGLAPQEPPPALDASIHFGLTPGLTAVLAFSLSGDATRAQEAMAAWRAHPENHGLADNPGAIRESVRNSDRLAFAERVAKVLG